VCLSEYPDPINITEDRDVAHLFRAQETGFLD
jgi:hypothetical protein